MVSKSYTYDELKYAQMKGLALYVLDTRGAGEDDILVLEKDQRVDQLIHDICSHLDLDDIPHGWTLMEVPSFQWIKEQYGCPDHSECVICGEIFEARYAVMSCGPNQYTWGKENECYRCGKESMRGDGVQYAGIYSSEKEAKELADSLSR